MLEHLLDRFDITLVTNFEPAKDSAYVELMPSVCHRFVPVIWREVKKYSLWFYARVLMRSLSRFPVTVQNDSSSDLRDTIEGLAKNNKYDLLVCDFLTPALNFSNLLGSHPTLLFEHNVESMIFKRHLDTASNPLLKLFWWMQWKKMVRFEKEMGRCFSAVVSVSESDKSVLTHDFGMTNVHVVPTGVDTNHYVPLGLPEEPLTLVFVGAMDWLPNEDGIVWFIRDVWPLIKGKLPLVKLNVVGRNPSRKLVEAARRASGITVTGRVPDVRPYIDRHCVYVVPLRIGGGTRIKIYEAMAMGKAVVSTSVGAEGLPLKSGEHLVLADTKEDMANAITWLLTDDEARRRIEKAARTFVEVNMSWDRASRIFGDFCIDTISKVKANHA